MFDFQDVEFGISITLLYLRIEILCNKRFSIPNVCCQGKQGPSGSIVVQLHQINLVMSFLMSLFYKPWNGTHNKLDWHSAVVQIKSTCGHQLDVCQ